MAELEGVLGGAGNRPGPAGRELLGGCPLAAGTGGNPTPGIEGTFTAALGQVPSHERAEVGAEREEHALVVGADRKAGADPGAGGAGHHERLGDRAESGGHGDPLGAAAVRPSKCREERLGEG